MEKIDWIDITNKCFEASGKKEIHVNDIADIALERRFLPASFTQPQIAVKITSSLARNVKSKNKQFRRVKNAKGSFKKGVYAQKNPQIIKLIRSEQPITSKNYIGKAGEYAVLSELLFRGYNASVMTVDEGIDVVASKDNKYFHIQVKTANSIDDKRYTVTLRKEAFQLSMNTFYIISLRRPQKRRYINDFVIFSSGDIRNFIMSKVLKETNNLNLTISVDNEQFFLNGSHKVTHRVNDFDSII